MFYFIEHVYCFIFFFFFFQAEDGIRDGTVTGVQTCALPIYLDKYLVDQGLSGTSPVDAQSALKIGTLTDADYVVIGTVNPSRTLTFSDARRSEEHTSELQSQFHLVCRLLLEKKNTRVARPSR